MEGLQNLGIDLTSLLIYAANFGLLVVVCYFLIYKKVVKAMDERRDSISSKLDQAEKIKADFQAQLEEMEASKKAAEANLKAELDKMSVFVAEKKKALVAEMEEEKANLLAKANEEIAQRKAELVSDIEKDLLGVVSKIVLEVVHNKVPADVIEQSVSEAWKNKSS